jgi:hypothetical protein
VIPCSLSATNPSVKENLNNHILLLATFSVLLTSVVKIVYLNNLPIKVLFHHLLPAVAILKLPYEY